MLQNNYMALNKEQLIAGDQPGIHYVTDPIIGKTCVRCVSKNPNNLSYFVADVSLKIPHSENICKCMHLHIFWNVFSFCSPAMDTLR